LPDGRRVWTQYAHLAEITVTGGDVQKGQQIGTIGKGDGNHYYAHLHFEVRAQYLAANWWPATHGWSREKAVEYYVEPTAFINAHRSIIPITPPQPVAPGNDSRLTDLRVVFRWNQPNVPNLRGYTLRVTDQPNLDAQPWIVDRGIGKEFTDQEWSFPAEFYGRRLYWGVKTLTTGEQTSGWSTVQTFIIERPVQHPTDTTAPALEWWRFDPVAARDGQVTINARATDAESGVREIAFWYNTAPNGTIDGSWVQIGVARPGGPQGAYEGSVAWEVSALPEGRYRVGIDLLDEAGNKIDAGTRRGITYIVDRSPPMVRITAPAPGTAFTEDTLTIAAELQDSLSGISNAQFFVYLNGEWRYIDSDVSDQNGWQISWSAAGIPDNQQFALAVVPIDQAGNWTSLSVDNLQMRRSGPVAEPVLEAVAIKSGDGVARTVFQPGDPIHLAISGQVRGGTAATVSLWWSVYNAQADRVASLSYDDLQVELSPGGWYYYLPTGIPEDLPPGTYTFRGELRYQGHQQVREQTFEVSRQSVAWKPDQWQAVSEFRIDGAVAHSGGRSARIDSVVENDARWTQRVAVKSGTSYLLSGWVKTLNVRSSVVGASLGLVDDWTRTPDVRGTQEAWTYVEVVIPSDTRTELWVGARLGHWGSTTTGTTWFDDLSLRERDANGTPVGPNLLLNPGFEQ